MVNCPKCGNELTKKDTNFCSKCGAQLDNKLKSDFNIDELEAKHNNKKSGKNIILAIVIVVLVVIVALFASGVLTVDQSSSDSAMGNTTSVNSDGGAGQYFASAKSDKFHSPDCEWAGKISESNKISYPSRQAAIDGGKVPCSVCNP